MYGPGVTLWRRTGAALPFTHVVPWRG